MMQHSGNGYGENLAKVGCSLPVCLSLGPTGRLAGICCCLHAHVHLQKTGRCMHTSM